MLSSRNIHFAILGIIIGASAGYVFAFYQAQSATPPPITQQAAADGSLPTGHPSTSDEGLDELKKEADANPNNAEVQARYGTRLFTAGRLPEAITVYEKVIALDPMNLTIRSLLIAMYFSQGNTAEAKKQVEVALAQNPNHVPTLHGYYLVTLEGDKDLKKAEEILKKIETLSPAYQGLPDLKARLEEVRKAQQ